MTKLSKHNKRVLIIVGIFCIAIITIGIVFEIQGMRENKFQQKYKDARPYVGKKQTEPETSIEYKLAVIDGKGYISKNHISIARFRSLLLQLSNTYVENRQQIADMTVRAQETLKEDEGIKESLLNMMEGMNQIFYEKIENQKYAEYMAAYMVLRRKGQSHSEAINGLKAIIEAIR